MGWGSGKFGSGPFGKKDFGEETVIRSFSETYLEDPKGEDGKNQTLLHYLQLIQDSVNRVKNQMDLVSDQVDFNKIRSDLLVYLGRTIGVEIDDSEPDEFQRSLVGSAVQFYRIKGTDQAYRIRGKISGFDVDVQNMYLISPAYVPFFDDTDIFELPPNSGKFFTDIPPGTVSGTPDEIGCDYCLTASIKIAFTIVKAQPPTVIGAANFFDRLIAKLRDIIPIHVRDVLFEIIAEILVDEHQYLLVDQKQYEDTFTNVQCFPHFDAIPADCTPLDMHGYIQGTTNETVLP